MFKEIKYFIFFFNYYFFIFFQLNFIFQMKIKKTFRNLSSIDKKFKFMKQNFQLYQMIQII